MRRAIPYLGAILALGSAGCRPHPQSIMPSAFAASSRAAFVQAAEATLPTERQVLRIGWRADDGHVELAGGGAVRIAPPDSLRLDIAASLGIGRSILLMMGDSVAAQPASAVDQVLPDRFALWAALGIMRPPPGRMMYEVAEDGVRTWWRATDATGRATVFEVMNGALQGVSRIEDGKTTSRLTLTRDRVGQVSRANLLDTGRGFRLQVTVNAREAGEAFAPEIWRLRS